MTSLSEYFTVQSQWRWHKAEEYPEDARNVQSARALESLAAYVAPDEDGQCEAGSILDALEPHLFEGFILGGEEAGRAVSRYGFGYETTGAHHEEFLGELYVLCLEDAYSDAAEGGDPTGTLYDFEIEAAKDGIYLSRRYWEHRDRSMQHELEEAIASYRGDQEDD